MKYLPVLIFIFLCSCSQSIYQVVTSETHPPKEPPDRFIKAIYLDRTMGTESDRQVMAHVLNKKKWEDFGKSIKPFSDDGKMFLVALKLFLSEHYEPALQTLEKIDDSDFSCQVQVLKTDCLFEMEGSFQNNYRVLYQKAMDCTRSDIIQSIILDRYKFLRYAP
jgi:hypothetical protein